MNMLKTELGARIENTTNDILRKKGINSNFNRILSQLFDPKNNDIDGNDDEKKDEEMDILVKGRAITNNFLTKFSSIYKEEVIETLMQIIIQSIKQKVAYSDDILFICFQYEITKKKRKPTQTILFKTIKTVILDILSHTENKADWYCIISYLVYEN